jgi:hypothetical protein
VSDLVGSWLPVEAPRALELLHKRLSSLLADAIKLAVTGALPDAAQSGDVSLHDGMVSRLSELQQASSTGSWGAGDAQHALRQCQCLLESMATFGMQSSALPLEVLNCLQALQTQASQLQTTFLQVQHANDTSRITAAFAWVPSMLVEALKCGDWVSYGLAF